MIKKCSLFIILAVLAILVFRIAFYFIYPDVAKLKTVNPKKTAFMEYREKEWAKQGRKKKIVQKWVPLSRISPYLVKAVIIAEDDKFWSHEGFDFEAMQKAIEKDLKSRKFRVGGSTISQQLAKNLYLSPARNPVRKIKEAILTWRLENSLSKKRIIELYLNVAEWGDGIFGIEAAAQRHFGKPAADLSAREAAKLATVLPNPRRYNPTGTGRYVENRSELIYQIMVRRGIVIPDYEALVDEPSGETPVEALPTGESKPPEREPSDGGEAAEKQKPPEKVLTPAAEP